MIQEIALVNLNLEPRIRQAGKQVLSELHANDRLIGHLLNECLNDTEGTIVKGIGHLFEN